MMKRFTFFFLLLCFTATACQRIILGPEVEASQTELFEMFWTDYDQHCGILFPKNIDWKAIRELYRPQVTDDMSDAELWSILTQMIEHLNDEHSFLSNPATDETYVSGSQGIDVAIQSFSKDLIADKYLDAVTIIQSAPDWRYGSIKDKDIGYIYVGDCDGNHPDQTIDEILAQLGQHQAIIFDVRNNGGGRSEFMLAISNAFADKEIQVYSTQTRNGPNHNDFDEKTWFSNNNDGINQFLKPVVLLTDRFSVSAAEDFSLHMAAMEHVSHIGDTTAGAFSSTSNRRFLPNGWLYQYPIQMELTPDGASPEGIGLIPSIISVNTPENINNKVDAPLERAFQFLDETYGIR